MPVIKRYPNRKLYDTETKQYITLEGIAELIREGRDLQVLDYSTREDLTALTLSQIIFEQQKKHSGFLPSPVLRGLIKAGGDTFNTLWSTLASTLGFWRYVDEEIERRVQGLVREGKLTREESCHMLDKLVRRERNLHGGHWPEEQELERLLAERGMPTRVDLQQIVEQLDELAGKLQELSKEAE
jgi:polyhydroxyalkanoate synthesis repressor PhaR